MIDMRVKTPQNVASSEIVGAIQRQVYDRKGIPLTLLVERLSSRFNEIEVRAVVWRLSNPKLSPVLRVDECDRGWPYVGGES